MNQPETATLCELLAMGATSVTRPASMPAWKRRKEQKRFMCTFKDEQTVQVCDVAIGRVRERLQEVFGDTVQFTTVTGQGTLVQASSNHCPFHRNEKLYG